MRRIGAAILLTLLAAPVAAQDCRAMINGAEVLIAEDVVDRPESSLLGRFGAATREFVRDPLNRRAPPCDGETTIAFMAAVEGLGADQAATLCLAPDAAGGEGYQLVPGERSSDGTCRRTVCERINLAAEDVLALTDAARSVVAGDPVEGVTGEDRLSGALLLSGQTGLLGAILNQGGSTLGSLVMSNPIALGAAATTVVATGGALYLCAEE
ncbi:hypothetical protein [Wenxinia saemankumensis]|uniref:Uncharacterized protein n=1 Tax=Wenxinia saemankumensis TaxID=1447782 RepID=A0A1M6AM13_9RHOB|nr:hypothetical protein [Wenxinia saemankumensis]SHI37539.1 hypothetical protein SAMN05444417_0511 [Wenxinia saemankumensis]